MRYLLATVTALFLTSCNESPPAEPTAQTSPAPAEKQAPSTADELTDTTEVTIEQPIELAEPLAVGDQAPDFRLLDQQGKERTLDELLADGNVALVFYRSADW